MTKYRTKRKISRKRWKRINKLKIENIDFTFPQDYRKLKKYELRKRRRNKIKTLYVDDSKIVITKHIDFEKNIDNIPLITNMVNKYINNMSKKKFIIDHSHIETASVAGLLYLVGQISKITKFKYNSSKINLSYNKKYGLKKGNLKLLYLLYKIGYWKYFGITKPYKLNKDIENNYFLSIETNIKSDIPLLNKIKSFINENVHFLQNNYELEYKFDDAVKEAMGNSIEHGYDSNFKENGKEKGRWWVCGHYDKKEKSLELVFYDYGIGIRESMKNNLGEDAKIAIWNTLGDAWKSDADLIEMAINGDLSKYKNYKEHDRGKGFKRFQNFAKSSNYDCILTIVSNKGKYRFGYDSINNSSQITKTTLKYNIDGMLIKWKIKLGNKD